MRHNFFDIAFTPNVAAAQARYGSRAQYEKIAARHGAEADDTGIGAQEAAFIAEQDGFYLATVSETGWPYVQFRGGPKGFLKVTGPRTLTFADLRGNRQYVSTGNVTANDRVALIIMDYARQARLKVLGRLTFRDAAEAPEDAQRLAKGYPKAVVERIATITVEAFDWNCPQHITPKFNAEQVEGAVGTLRSRIGELEAEIARLKSLQEPVTDPASAPSD